jgi:hypothetical protein
MAIQTKGGLAQDQITDLCSEEREVVNDEARKYIEIRL